MSEFVIKHKNDFFDGCIWVPEYSDAIIFETREEAERLCDNEGGAVIVNYGLEDEEIVFNSACDGVNPQLSQEDYRRKP